MRLSLLVLLMVVPAVLAADEKKEKKLTAREVKVAGLAKARKAFGEPVKITTQAELEKAIDDKEAREKIIKEVDLKNEFLLLFVWGGSGKDILEMQEKDGVQTFNYYRGRTKDLRIHVKLFALPNKTENVLPKAPYPLAK